LALSGLSNDIYPNPLLTNSNFPFSSFFSILFFSIFALVIFPYLLKTFVKSSSFAVNGIFFIYKLQFAFCSFILFVLFCKYCLCSYFVWNNFTSNLCPSISLSFNLFNASFTSASEENCTIPKYLQRLSIKISQLSTFPYSLHNLVKSSLVYFSGKLFIYIFDYQ